jgi:hypothetical protein
MLSLLSLPAHGLQAQYGKVEHVAVRDLAFA